MRQRQATQTTQIARRIYSIWAFMFTIISFNNNRGMNAKVDLSSQRQKCFCLWLFNFLTLLPYASPTVITNEKGARHLKRHHSFEKKANCASRTRWHSTHHGRGLERAAETPSPPTLPPPHERALTFEIQVTGKSGVIVSSIDVTSSQPLPSPLSLIMIGPRMIGFVIEG